jgi:hypothetical protein
MAVRQTSLPMNVTAHQRTHHRLDLCRRTRSLLRHGTNKTEGTGGGRKRHAHAMCGAAQILRASGCQVGHQHPPGRRGWGAGLTRRSCLLAMGQKTSEQSRSVAQRSAVPGTSGRPATAGVGQLWLAPAGTTPLTRRRQRVC